MNQGRRDNIIDPPSGHSDYGRPSGTGYRGPLPRREDEEIIERIAWLLDRSIPLGGGYSIGLDPIIGLIPGLGDFVSAGISSVIIVKSYQAGIPRSTLLRMVANVGIDAVVGAIPLFGDIFDFAFKASTKNLNLYRESMAGLRDPRRDTTFLVVVLAVLFAIIAIPVTAVVLLVTALL